MSSLLVDANLLGPLVDLAMAALDAEDLRAARAEARRLRNASGCEGDGGPPCWKDWDPEGNAPEDLCGACLERDKHHKEYTRLGPLYGAARRKVTNRAKRIAKLQGAR